MDVFLLRAAVAADPADRTARLALADALREAGDELAAVRAELAVLTTRGPCPECGTPWGTHHGAGCGFLATYGRLKTAEAELAAE